MGSISNKIVFIIGALMCSIYIAIPCSDGLLGEGVTNAFGVLNQDMTSMLLFFLLPVLLMIAAGVILFIKNRSIVAMILTIVAGVLFIVMDIRFAINNQAYLGCYINAIGAIIAMAAASLGVFDNAEEYEEEQFDDEYLNFDSADFYRMLEKTSLDAEHIPSEKIRLIEESFGNSNIDEDIDKHDYSDGSFWK